MMKMPKLSKIPEGACMGISKAETTTPSAASKPPKQGGARSTVGTQIGNTTYDLQTNYGVCRRVALESSGTVHATWTRSTSGDVAAPDRGTGYNVSADNGATWGPAPTARIEGSLRTGWPNVGVTASGRIFSITHTSAQGMNFCYKDPGALGWTNRIIGEELGDITGVWPRVGNDGNSIHAVISRQEGNASGVPGGIYYFRSLDGGTTWEGPRDIPGIDESYIDMSADSYFVDVKGSTVVIGIAMYAAPVVIFKSTNSGDTFTKIIVQNTSNPLIPASPGDGDVLEPVAVGGGGISTIIDNSGKVHVWFDRVFNYKDASVVGGPFYLPNSTCIMYWNEDMAAPRVLGETVRQDYDQDGTTSVSLIDTAPGVEVQSYGVSMVGQPSAGIDAAGNLYVAYSAMVDGAYETPAPNKRRQYRDIFLIKSTDGGMTWTGPLNVTNSNNEED
ncbi:MAG TPA: sialidase family protein, partial [Chitinophagales bacterium]|nr:sialidase family protein [Chitinophagales bacterium]